MSARKLCLICQKPIEVGDPFFLALVETGAEPSFVAMHHACQMTAIAGEVAAAVSDAIEKGEEPQRVYVKGARYGDLITILRRLARQAIG